MCTICASSVSEPIFSARTTSVPLPLIVAPESAQLTVPGCVWGVPENAEGAAAQAVACVSVPPQSEMPAMSSEMVTGASGSTLISSRFVMQLRMRK